MELQDKIAVITGGGRGIGRVIALAYAREGANLVLASRSKESLEETHSARGLSIGEEAPATATIDDFYAPGDSKATYFKVIEPKTQSST